MYRACKRPCLSVIYTLKTWTPLLESLLWRHWWIIALHTPRYRVLIVEAGDTAGIIFLPVYITVLQGSPTLGFLRTLAHYCEVSISGIFSHKRTLCAYSLVHEGQVAMFSVRKIEIHMETRCVFIHKHNVLTVSVCHPSQRVTLWSCWSRWWNSKSVWRNSTCTRRSTCYWWPSACSPQVLPLLFACSSVPSLSWSISSWAML